MVRTQVGNRLGLAAKDQSPIIAEITADGANTVTVSAADVRRFRVGQTIDIVNKTTGAVLATGRTVDTIAGPTGVLTYSGANVDSTPGTHSVYSTGGYEVYPPAGAFARDPYTNLNGGPSSGSGLTIQNTLTVDDMRARLKAISGTTYSDAQLDLMTYNDLVYAIRLNDAPGSV